MKRKPKISIEEQLYRAGIWERPPTVIPYNWHIARVTDAMIGIMPEKDTNFRLVIGPLFHKDARDVYVIRYPDADTGRPMLREWDGERWGEPINLT